jgi:hypothetical protein
VHEHLEKKSSECTPTRESKNSFVNSGGVAPESLIPSREAKSDAESEINLFTFPQEGDTLVCADPGHSPLLSPARMNSSSSDHENQDVKQEPHEGPYVLDPNDEFDLRNGVLKSDIYDCLPSSSGSDRNNTRPERTVITEEDVQNFKEKANCWAYMH